MLSLVPHPDFPSAAVRTIAVDVDRQARGELVLRYHVTGDLGAVAWPSLNGAAERVDGLWQHTCFEAFVGYADEPAYCELNFAAAKWAAYQFDDYRAGMRNLDRAEYNGHWVSGIGLGVVHARLPDLDQKRDWRLGVSVVVEAKDGGKSYWALKHPPGKPDFHHADCFAARLAAPAGA